MTDLEDRLRADLPMLADALTGEVVEVAEDEWANPVTRFGGRSLAFAVAGLVGIAGLGVAAVALNRTPATTEIDVASTALGEFGTWAPIAEAPIETRPYAATAWTGVEVVFWAGSNLQRGFAYSDAASYDPATDSWSALAGPGWGHPGLTSVFFGGELYALAKGGGTRFDPSDGEWRELPTVDGMYLAATVTTDEAVFGLGPADTNAAGQPDLAIVRYDSILNSWTYGPVFEGTDEQAEIVAGLSQLETTTIWTGEEIVAWRGTEGGIAFDPSRETWRTVAPPQSPSGLIRDLVPVATEDGIALLAEVENADGRSANVAVFEGGGWRWLETAIPIADFDSVTVAAAGDWLVVFSADQSPVVIDLDSGVWVRVDDGPLGGVVAPNTAWTGDELIIWGGVKQNANAADGARWSPPSS